VQNEVKNGRWQKTPNSLKLDDNKTVISDNGSDRDAPHRQHDPHHPAALPAGEPGVVAGRRGSGAPFHALPSQ